MTPDNGKTKQELEGASLFKTLIVSFSLVAIFACLSIGVLTYILRANGIRDNQYRLLETLRDEKVRFMSDWFRERTGDVAIMVTRPDITAVCEIHGAGGTVAIDEITRVMSAIRDVYQYDEIFLSDVNGATIASTETDPVASVNLPVRLDAVQRAIEQRQNVVSDVVFSKVHKKPTYYFFSPVFSPENTELIGVLGILIDPAVGLYPRFTYSSYLGETGEILLVNNQGVVQSPLKYREKAIASMTIRAEPAQRGASGSFGIIAIEDYRQEPVMAAYGHIREFNWGIVVKQDMDEINAPVRIMARNVAGAAAGVLLLALLFGLVIARRISTPAKSIAETAVLIGQGNLDIRVPQEGPAEIQQIAANMNGMVKRLGLQLQVSRAMADIVAAAARHNRLLALLEESLPLLMEKTRSQLGVVYLAGADENKLDLMVAHGLDTARIAKQITISPPDHLLVQSLSTNAIHVLSEIPDGNALLVNTQAGDATPRALLSIPLVLQNKPVGVIGLASLYDYDAVAAQIAEGTKTNLAQAIELCASFEQTEKMGKELNKKNQKIMATNEELQSTSAELNAQAREQDLLIKELEMQRQQVAEADRLKTEFLSNMSHELRTPLNSVLSLSQLMLASDVGAGGGEDKERLKIIERNGRRLLNLINDILDLSKIEAGKMELYPSVFSAKEVTEAIVATLRPMAEEKGLRVAVEVAESVSIRTDKDKLQQILLNLLSNASKFTDAGTIGINVEAVGDAVVFYVRDTGCGIPRDVLPYIFDEFRQVDGSTTRRHGGTGLGLAICQRLTTLLGGKLEVESEEGEGTTFAVTLPIKTGKSEPPIREEETDAATAGDMKRWQPGSAPPRILVVEDNDVAAEQIETALTTDGFTVDRAADGQVALNKVKQHLPDGIVLDLMMPRTDGFEVLNVIRSKPETAHLPFLILTAKDLTAKERENLTQNHVQQLIQKGQVNREQLVGSVRRLIGMRDDASVTPQPEPPAVTRPRPMRRTGGKVTVLIVEDNPDNLMVTKDILGSMDVDLLEAHDGKEALETATARRPDIIVMDINLPVMSGVECLTRIRMDDNLKQIVVIALTAKAMMGDREELLASGFDDYLSKPIEPDKLQNTVREWIEGNRG
ncbi:MAG: response regulator [Deltaproteobacteria bacterium]|nr:response regulator [Deltaproteobacteria bacterium]